MMINPLLKIMDKSKDNGSPEPEWMTAVLQYSENQVPGVHEFCKKKEIKVLIGFGTGWYLSMKEMQGITALQNEFCC